MSLDLAGALAKLAELTADNRVPTAAELKALVSEVSADASGRITMLYSGRLPDDVKGGALVNAMAQGEDLRVIGKTDAAKLLQSRQFEEAVASAFGCTTKELAILGHPANTFLEATDGLWGDISERFAAATKGEVRIVMGKIEAGRIFEVRELPQLLDKSSLVSSIEGIPIDELKKLGGKALERRPNDGVRSCNNASPSLISIHQLNTWMGNHGATSAIGAFWRAVSRHLARRRA